MDTHAHVRAHTHTHTHIHTHTHTHTAVFNQLQPVCKEFEHCHQSAAEAVAAASFLGCGVFPCWSPLVDLFTQVDYTPG